MPPTAPRVDHETVYKLLYGERWSDLIDLVHRNRESIKEDELLSRAVGMFAGVFLGGLGRRKPSSVQPELEKLFLLHVGGFHRLEADQFERTVEALVRLNLSRPATAAGYARHCPENPICAEVLGKSALRKRLEHADSDAAALDAVTPSTDRDATVSLFKSEQEKAFFLAVREVFATYLVYPNVALSSMIDFETIRGELTADERNYFFRGVIDCVVFDQHGDYRPLYFFELDSPLHDDVDRQAADRCKDRIVSLAGRKLIRVRPRGRRSGKETFLKLLKSL